MDVDERAGHGAAEAAEGVRGEGGPGSRGVYGVWVGRDDGRLMTLYWGVLQLLLPEPVYPTCGGRFQGRSLPRVPCVLFRARAVIKGALCLTPLLAVDDPGTCSPGAAVHKIHMLGVADRSVVHSQCFANTRLISHSSTSIACNLPWSGSIGGKAPPSRESQSIESTLCTP